MLFRSRRAAEEDGRLVAHHDRLVGHRRHIGAAGGAGAHHHGDLRDAARRHVGLIVEDAAEVIAVGEDLVLIGQIGAARIDQIDAGQLVLGGDLLGAEMLLHRHRIVGAALHGGVVGDDQALAPRDAADAGDDAGGRDLVAVHAVGRQLAELQEGRAAVGQEADAVARQEFSAGDVAGDVADAGDIRNRSPPELHNQTAHRPRTFHIPRRPETPCRRSGWWPVLKEFEPPGAARRTHR